jgi:polygalacturonase
VSGFDLGTFLDGTFKTTQEFAPDKDRVTGRLKFGTESNGGFKNITISNINFVHCRGLALETVDGGYIEDVSITNITMRDITTAPIFIRLGKRQRAPDGTPVAKIRRVIIDNVVVSDAHHEYASIIAGLAESPVEDVRLSNIRIHYKGGGTKADAERVVPENEKSYPEPSMFGVLPAYGFYIRHAKGITFDNVKLTYGKTEERPAFVLDDVKGIDLFRIDAQPSSSFFVLKNVENFSVQQSKNIKDQRIERADKQQL